MIKFPSFRLYVKKIFHSEKIHRLVLCTASLVLSGFAVGFIRRKLKKRRNQENDREDDVDVFFEDREQAPELFIYDDESSATVEYNVGGEVGDGYDSERSFDDIPIEWSEIEPFE
mmetsp:Transcript_7863/g.15759  ORF Transcript_7863/g.15759 Transcript_7863/m.15759 type:complete len:115 (-) Transcript_7863:45-389(-)